MKYPISHLSKFEEIEQIVKKWPVEKEFDHVLKWLMQFDSEDLDIGIRVVRNLNVIGFEDLNTALSIAYSKLERMAIDKGTKISSRNTLFAGIGDGAKSGAMIGYNFRLINEIPEDNFIDDESIQYLEQGMIDNVVLIDDIVGTGDQALKEIKALTDKITPFGVKNIFLLTAVGMKDGIDKIAEKTKAYVFSAFEYSELDTVTSLDSYFYEGISHEKRASLRTRLEYYGKVSNKAGIGYGGIGALIAFYYNTPNISLPVIWGSKNSWIPLFKRTLKINGINSYYKQIETSINKKKKQKETIHNEEEIILLVEGKSDEAFFEYISEQIIDQVPFAKINVISLGGYSSKKLIDNIARLSAYYLFIIEDDPISNKFYMTQVINNIAENPHIFVKSFIYYININVLFQDEYWSKLALVYDKIENNNSSRFLHELEKEIKRRILMRGYLLKDFISRFVDVEKIFPLKKILIEKIKEQAESQTNS
jgi:hypothetical protein